MSAWLRNVGDWAEHPTSALPPVGPALTEPNLSFADVSTAAGGRVVLEIGLDLEFKPPWKRSRYAGDPYLLRIVSTPEALREAARNWDQELGPGTRCFPRRSGISPLREFSKTTVSETLFHKQPKLMQCFFKVQTTTCRVEVRAITAPLDPVVLRPFPFAPIEDAAFERRPGEIDPHPPARVVESANLDTFLVFPVPIAVAGEPRLQPGHRAGRSIHRQFVTHAASFAYSEKGAFQNWTF